MNASMEYLLLDPEIRDWVVLPMLIMLLLVGMGRQYVSTLIKSEPKTTMKDLIELRYKAVLGRSQVLRMNGSALSARAFNVRKAYLIRPKVGLLREKDLPGPTNPLNNMNTMMDMVKGNVAMYVPNIAMMSFVGYFFSGFVCLKMPFSMPSTHFKVMLQRGVDLSNLDVSYVSSLSWYFMLMFGLNDVYALILGESAEMDEAQVRDAHLPSLSSLLAPANVAVAFLRPPYRQRMMQMQMGMAAQQPGFDAASLYRQEKDLVR